MARGVTYRSQRRTQPSQSQSSQVQRRSQRANPRAAHDDENSEEEDENEEEEDEPANIILDEDEDGEVATQGVGARVVNDEMSRRAHDLVRLALFTEQKRMPLRREEISKKVLGENKRSFNEVFRQAQNILIKTFGMELVELKSGAIEDPNEQGDTNDADLEEARNNARVRKKVTNTGSKTYILRSVLDPVIIERAAIGDEVILVEESANMPDDGDDGDGFGTRTYGTIIAWTSADQLGALGILYVILSLVLVSGKVMSDVELRAVLRRLQLPATAHIPCTNQSTHKNVTVDSYLNSLIRQGYLQRRAAGDSKAKRGGGSGKRIRPTQGGGEDDGTTWEWRWGHRAHSEIGEKGLAQFMAEFMAEAEKRGVDGDEEEVEGDGEGRAARQRREKREAAAKKKLEALLKGIGRAAGGNLTDIK